MQTHKPADEEEVYELQRRMRRVKDEGLREKRNSVKSSLPEKMQRVVELVSEKGSTNWLTVIPLKDMDFDLNKREFRDAIRLRYDWAIPDNQPVCVCGALFTTVHAIICKRGGFNIQRHNELRDLEAELLNTVCYDVGVEPVLQPVSWYDLNRGTNQAPDARLDIHASGFWERQRSAHFDI